MDLLEILMNAYIEKSYMLRLSEAKAASDEFGAAAEAAKIAVTDIHRKGLWLAVDEGNRFYKQGFADAVELFTSKGGDTDG